MGRALPSRDWDAAMFSVGAGIALKDLRYLAKIVLDDRFPNLTEISLRIGFFELLHKLFQGTITTGAFHHKASQVMGNDKNTREIANMRV